MESFNSQSNRLPRTTYDNAMFMCLFTSLAFFISVSPAIPVEGQEFSEAYIVSRICLSIAIVWFDVAAVWLIRNRNTLHCRKEAFWPKQCRHCAYALGVLALPSRVGTDQENFVEPGEGRILQCDGTSRPERVSPRLTQSVTNESLESSSLGREEFSRDQQPLLLTHETITHPPRSFGSATVSPTLQDSSLHADGMEDSLENLHCDQQPHQHIRKVHKSLLKTYTIFGIIALLNLPLEMAFSFMCLKHYDRPMIVILVQFTSAIADISCMSLIIIAAAVMYSYRDAVIINDSIMFKFIGLGFAISICVAVCKLIYPIVRVTNSLYNHQDVMCFLNGTWGDILLADANIITPFYAECAIIAASISWQIWANMVPRSFVRRTSINFDNEDFTTKSLMYYWKTILTPLETAFQCCVYLRDNTKGTHRIVEKPDSCQKMQSFVRRILIFLIMVGATFCAICIFVLPERVSHLSKNDQTYIHLSMEISVCIPLLALYRYHSSLTNNSKNLSMKSHVSVHCGLMESHDRLLLLGCCGSFLFESFILAGGIKKLIKANSLTRQDLLLTVFSILHKLFCMYFVWMMTSFLLVVQRRMTKGLAEAKWTMVCLIYTAVLNATKWILNNFDMTSYITLQMYYGSIQGELIGALLEPVLTLYNLHASMIAYEVYKDTFNEFKEHCNQGSEFRTTGGLLFV